METETKQNTIEALLTKEQIKQLNENYMRNEQRRLDGNEEHDFRPVVKLFTPDGGATWLLTELDPDGNNIAFGLCDLGLGFPELGNVSLREVLDLRGKLGLSVERDRHFQPQAPLSVYAKRASETRLITTDLFPVGGNKSNDDLKNGGARRCK